MAADRGRALEGIVGDALRDAGTDMVVASPERERGADLAVWSDVLQPFVGNPLIVEIKVRIKDKTSAKKAVEQLTSHLARSGARWALLLYAEGPASTAPLWGTAPSNVLVMYTPSAHRYTTSRSSSRRLCQASISPCHFCFNWATVLGDSGASSPKSPLMAGSSRFRWQKSR